MRLAGSALASLLLGAPAFAATDPCLTGTWRGEIAQALDLYRSISPVPVAALDGTVTLVISADGTAQGRIDGFHVDVEQGGMTLVNSGEGTFSLVLQTEGSTVTGRFTAFDVRTRAEMRGPAGTPPKVLKESGQGVADLPDRSVSAGYTCDAETMTIVAAEPQQMPVRVWTRQ